jgi:hypothetical protein
MHAEATKHVLLGRKSLGCPVTISRSGGNDLGGEQTWGVNIKEWLQSRKRDPSRNRLDGEKREADLDSVRGKADDAEEETGMCTPRNRRGQGPRHPGRIHRDNVGKVPPAAGAGSNLQRLLERG